MITVTECIVVAILLFWISCLNVLIYHVRRTNRDQRLLLEEKDSELACLEHRQTTLVHRMVAIRHTASMALNPTSDSHPYRDFPERRLCALEDIIGAINNAVEEEGRVSQCFSTPNAAAAFIRKVSPGGDAFIVPVHEWDATCYHVIYSADLEPERADRRSR